jgi:hypothetical protein
MMQQVVMNYIESASSYGKPCPHHAAVEPDIAGGAQVRCTLDPPHPCMCTGRLIDKPC